MYKFIKQSPLGELYINPETNRFFLHEKGVLETNVLKIWRKFETARIPLKAKIEITGKCNLRCYYCYNAQAYESQQLTTKDILNIFHTFENLNIAFLELTGGEPFMRNDMEFLLNYLNTKNFIVSIITNGTLINQKHLDILKKMKSVKLYVSLLAPVEKECDRLTGVKGSFRRIMRSVIRIMEQGINLDVSVTLTHENIKYYKEFHELERKIGRNFRYSIGADPKFDALEDNLEYSLTEDDLSLLPHYFPENLFSAGEALCGAGCSQFYIANNGDLYPCFKFRLNMGNILEKDFKELWNDRNNVEAVRKALSRSDPNPGCTDCQYAETCFYCPGIAYQFKNYKNGKFMPYYCSRAKELYYSKMKFQNQV